MEEPSKGGYKSAAPTLCGLIAVYFFFPYAFAWPLAAVYNRHQAAPAWVQAFFWPVDFLSRQVPAYRALLEVEGRWCGWN